MSVPEGVFRLAILKLTAFCDLNWTYCYMFNQADHTYERVPRQMPLAIASIALQRVEEHCKEHGISAFHLTLHGGEPTLWPLRSFSAFLDSVEGVRARGLQLTVGTQSNAYRYDPQLLRLFAEHEVSIGISLDGPKHANDKARVNHSGGGSYERVMANVNRMLDDGYSSLIRGFLSVARPDVPAQEFLEWQTNFQFDD
jgi:uncharacterized protein